MEPVPVAATLTCVRSLLPIALAAVTVVPAGCTTGTAATSAPSAPATVSTACASPIDTGPLPEWARAGFSGDSSMPHTMGERGEIVAALFGHPLAASRSDGVSNKILWVSKVAHPPGDLVIEAKLDGTSVTETRRVTGGPGPSIIDLPRSGCWRLTLTWPEHTDTMGLVYR